MNTGAMASLAPMPHVSVYSASKMYSDYLVQPLNWELSEYGVEVSSFRPASVATKLIPQEGNSLKEKVMYTPELTAEQAFQKRAMGLQHGPKIHEIAGTVFKNLFDFMDWD